MLTSLTSGVVGRCHGRGPNMLLIHGVGMQSDYWRNIEPALAQHFTLSIIDLPGAGGSALLDHEDPPLSLYTDKVSDVLAMQESPAIVVGHSMGALIALDLAVRYPLLVAGIAALNGVCRRSIEAQSAIDARVAELTQSLKNNEQLGSAIDSAATLERWFGERPTGDYATARELCKAWLQSTEPAGYLAAYTAFAKADAPTDQELQRISCPALFITGADEPNSTPAMSRHMSKQVEGSQCIIIENAKHMMTMTHRQEVLDALVNCFVQDAQGGEGESNVTV